MFEKTLLFNADECIGCFSCQVACQNEHNLDAGERWIRIFKSGPFKVGGKLTMRYAAVRCRHCGKPPCMEVCPAEAISKRSDGTVLFKEELCIGCKACIEVCPFGAPQYNFQKNIVRACNHCIERTDQGLDPSCVRHCPTKALYFENCNSISLSIRVIEEQTSRIQSGPLNPEHARLLQRQ